ncbi:hypothetical protein GCM10028803_29050 [Larkinella knui]
MVGITAAAMLLGGAAWAVKQKIDAHETGPGSSNDEAAIPTNSPVTELPADIDVAGKVTDRMSFDEAFAAARQEVGMGGVFGWQGHWYNTFEKEEWSSLSLEQRQEYTEQITGEQLPVKPYGPTSAPAPNTQPAPEPTLIEGSLNGQRVMGLDFDHDGIIDTLVLDGADGKTYRVVDATGDAGLDTVYQYDSLDGELTGLVRLEQPIILTNDDFSNYLESTMSQEVVDSILEPDAATPEPVTGDGEGPDDTGDDDTSYIADAYQPDDDTYINNGDVRDLDE